MTDDRWHALRSSIMPGCSIDGELVREVLAERDALAERADAAEAEVEALKHDIERHIAIASSEADYAEKLHKALRQLMEAASLQADASDIYLDTFGEAMNVAADALATPSAHKGPQQTTTGEGTE